MPHLLTCTRKTKRTFGKANVLFSGKKRRAGHNDLLVCTCLLAEAVHVGIQGRRTTRVQKEDIGVFFEVTLSDEVNKASHSFA